MILALDDKKVYLFLFFNYNAKNHHSMFDYWNLFYTKLKKSFAALVYHHKPNGSLSPRADKLSLMYAILW